MKTIADLNSLYTEAESVDAELFAEQRSNCLLVSGDHYTKKGSKFWNRIRDSKAITEEQKIRLTKNHIQKITKTYINNITSMAPGVAVTPKNDNELQDQKAAELNEAVWADLKHRQKVKKKIRDQWSKDFIEIGECFVKTFFDPNAGELKGYEAEIQKDEDGNPIKDPMGNVIPLRDAMGGMVPSTKPVFTGSIVYERYFGFNVLRAPSAKSMDESPYLILRKMSPIKDLEKMVGDDEDKLKFIQEGSQDVYTVFDGANGSFNATKGQSMVREFYFRPCIEYPKGYYYIATPHGILFEGELPFGIFPIKYVGFDEIATSPRARSIIKVIRPYQAEINRSASKVAEHQVTLGDDKLLIQSGTKLTHGGTLAGVRGIQYTGMPPGILPGRNGEQYINYMSLNIKEMYEVSNVYEDSEELKAGADPYAMLYRSIRHKKKFSYYAEKFEEFLIEICEVSLELAKNYYTDDMLVPAVGKREYINLAEFRSQKPLCYQIKVMPQTDDADTKLGKQLSMNQVIQYCSKELGKDGIGRIIRAMPFVNEDEAFNDLTIDYDNSVNDILQLDRGEMPQVGKYDNHPYIIRRATHRMKQGDFKFLPPQIQQAYAMFVKQHEMVEAQVQSQILAAQADFIPTGGYGVKCDFYIQDPKNQGKTRRAEFPYEALAWLSKRIMEQNSGFEQLEGTPPGALAEMGGMIRPGVPGGHGGMMPPAHPQPPGPTDGPGLIPAPNNVAL